MAWRTGRRSIALAALCLLAIAAAASADARLDRTVHVLQQVQNPDGGFGGRPGAASDPDFSAWVALGLAAAGINPQDQAQPAGASVYAYLAQHADELSATTDYERVLLVAIAAGTPRNLGPDLVAAVLARQLPDGSFAHTAADVTGGVNDTAFAVLALAPLGEANAVQRAVAWLLSVQRPDGAWAASAPDGPPDADITGAVLQALAAAGARPTDDALTFLRTLQNGDGGFAEQPGDSSNVASTAWVVQGLWAFGIDPNGWIGASGADPLDYLASLQQPDGLICWRADDCSNPIWMTAYAAPAFAGRPLPLAAVPRKVVPPDPPPTESDGVIAGGGGSGAALFSRPQPQSRGATTGGVRDVRPRSTHRNLRSAGLRSHTAHKPALLKRARPRRSAGAVSDEISGRVIGGADRAAPGLRSATATTDPWPARILLAAIALAALLGSGIELRRLETIR